MMTNAELNAVAQRLCNETITSLREQLRDLGALNRSLEERLARAERERDEAQARADLLAPVADGVRRMRRYSLLPRELEQAMMALDGEPPPAACPRCGGRGFTDWHTVLVGEPTTPRPCFLCKGKKSDEGGHG